MKRLWQVREFSTLMILALEVAFFTWYLWPDSGGHPFLNVGNGLLILKYSSIYGIAAIGAAIVIITGGIDLSSGAVIGLTSVRVTARSCRTRSTRKSRAERAGPTCSAAACS